MDVFIEYAHEGDLPTTGKPTSGLAELNAALLKIKSEPHPPSGGFGIFAGLMDSRATRDPLPLSTERHACLQKRSDEAKQQREDQRVIADAIRSGAFNPPPVRLPNSKQARALSNHKAKPKTKGASRHDSLRPWVELAIEECIGKPCTTITELTTLVMVYLTGSIGIIGSPVVDEKDGAIIFEDKQGKAHTVKLEALKKRVQRKFKTNDGMLEAQRNTKRTLSGRKDATG